VEAAPEFDIGAFTAWKALKKHLHAVDTTPTPTHARWR
jgi:hypothetical protein